ncbi:MAG: 2-dehydro-3-deoxy-6-phosphogalactonate aldolase [Geminicoccaceae bacterium]
MPLKSANLALVRQCMRELPLVAILRGLRPAEAADIGAALVKAGFRLIEVPLNSPDPLESIRILADGFGDEAVIGAGTVLDPADAGRIADAGGRLAVMPCFDPEVVAASNLRGLVTAPGVATPGEAFAALRAHADILKIFPAEGLPPEVVKAWRAVLPASVDLLPVGGITPERMEPYVRCGASGFGLGSALYKAGMSATEVGGRARAFVEAWRGIRP